MSFNALHIKNKLYNIINDKENIANAIKSKGVNVSENYKIDDLSGYVDNIDVYDLSRSVISYNGDDVISLLYSHDGECSTQMQQLYNTNVDISHIHCGDNVTNISMVYNNCHNLTGFPVCGNNVVNMYKTYSSCYNLTGSPVCGDKVTDMYDTYFNCYSLTGFPVCGNNVTDMRFTYQHCHNLTGSPVCGDNVIDMYCSYVNCYNLTGNPVCGENVVNMSYTYYICRNLTGSPVCGNNVVNMSYAYYNCQNLTGFPVCGENVTNMYGAYWNCTKLSGNGYFYSNKVNNAKNCFYNRNTSNRLNLYVPLTGYNSTYNTLNTCLNTSSTYSLVGKSVKWANSYTANGYYFNKTYNIYIYPVNNVAQARLNNND